MQGVQTLGLGWVGVRVSRFRCTSGGAPSPWLFRWRRLRRRCSSLTPLPRVRVRVRVRVSVMVRVRLLLGLGLGGWDQEGGQETTLDPIWQIMLIPVGRYCSISGRIYFLCNLLHRFGVSTHFSYTCRKGRKKRTSGPNSGQIFMRLSLNRFFGKFLRLTMFLVPTNHSPRKMFCFVSR